jgi:ABC-type transport system involved in cytochrome c biogenesis permease subunit
MTNSNLMEILMAAIGAFCFLSGIVTLLFVPETKSALRTRGHLRAALWIVAAILALIANDTYHRGPMSPTAYVDSIARFSILIAFIVLFLGAVAGAGWLLIKWSGLITKDLRATSGDLTPSTK